MPASPPSATIARIEAADPPQMHPTEWELRRELLRVTNDIAEADTDAQRAGWMLIAHYALKRAIQIGVPDV